MKHETSSTHYLTMSGDEHAQLVLALKNINSEDNVNPETYAMLEWLLDTLTMV